MSLELLSFVTIICFFVIWTVVLLFFPHKVVEFLGKFYRRAYKTNRNMSDDEIDSLFQLPTNRYLMGRRSEFIRFAPEDPQRFTRLILACRIAGLILLLFWAAIGVGLMCVAILLVN